MPSRPAASLVVLALAGLTGCATTGRLSALEARLGAIEAALGVGASAQAREEEAKLRLAEVHAAVRAGRAGDAKAGLLGLLTDYAGTQAADRASGMAEELSVVGERAPTLERVDWLQGEGDLSSSKATIVVFWEVWCPYCRRFVPEVQDHLDALAGEGLGVVSLTQVSRDTSAEEILDFAASEGLTFPIGVGDAPLYEVFMVSGIPAAAVVQDGEIVWRGHPVDLDAGYLRSLLQ